MSVVALTAAAVIAASALGAPASSPGFPRIAVRNGSFVDSATGKPFTPVGFNYYRTGKLADGKVHHATFCPGFYDADYIERMMAAAEGWGFNTVRTFQVYYVGKDGILTSRDAREISPAYLANVVDFLRRAKAHGIHVIFTWDIWLPDSAWWADEKLPFEAQYHFQPKWDPGTGVNGFRMALPMVRERANAIVALIRAIRRVDPSLLPVVLSWEIENEVWFDTTKAPLNAKQGTYHFAGRDFDVATAAGKQAFMDAAASQWARFCAEAVHWADPDALTSVSVFTFGAVGRKGPGTLAEDRTADTRVPADPMALLDCGLNYLDLHLYAWRSATETVQANLDRDLASDRWARLKAQAARRGLPVLCGETGVFAHYLRRPDGTIDHALGLQCLRDQLEGIKQAGLAGALYWPYGNPDSTPNDELPALALFPRYAQVLREVWLGAPPG